MSQPRSYRILIDGSMARGGGGFTYLVNLLPHLCAIGAQHRFRVLLRNESLARSLPPIPNLEVALLPEANWVERLVFTYRALPRLGREWDANLYFSAGETAPLRTGRPTIASFRNPIVYTDLDVGLSWRQRLRICALHQVSRLSSLYCDRILFVSSDSAQWIGDSLGIPMHRRAVVHHGIDADAWMMGGLSAFDECPTPYILSVSSVYWHKNFVRLIEAYAALARWRDDLPDLVIIGDVQHPDCWREMQRARAEVGADLAERIHLLGEVPYAEIRNHYARAELFVFPSYLETFGHPLLEAMASGVPIVAADIAVFREIAGDAALYADPHKTEALAAAMEEALFTSARRDLIDRGRSRVRQFGWSNTAVSLLALFDELLEPIQARS